VKPIPADRPVAYMILDGVSLSRSKVPLHLRGFVVCIAGGLCLYPKAALDP
jgi:hypothetical protein